MKLKHVAITPDGNRRYAKANGLELSKAYAKGFKKVEEAIQWALEKKIPEISFWALSLDNLKKRNSFEKKIIYSLMKQEINSSIDSGKLSEKNIKVKFFGRLELLPKTLYSLLKKLEEKTKENFFKLNIGIAYSGKDEIIQAAKAFAEDYKKGKVNEANEKTFSNYLFLASCPDLIIRTGGVQRLSGFLPFQAAYSEIYFSKKLWPDFEKTDFENAINYFNSIERRFGR